MYVWQRPVDLMGRLSNPPEHLNHLVVSHIAGTTRGLKRRDSEPVGHPSAANCDVPEEPGRLSNPAPRPVQRRLDAADVDLIAVEHAAGRSLRDIAKVLGVHHCTVAEHLAQLGIERRTNVTSGQYGLSCYLTRLQPPPA